MIVVHMHNLNIEYQNVSNKIVSIQNHNNTRLTFNIIPARIIEDSVTTSTCASQSHNTEQAFSKEPEINLK